VVNLTPWPLYPRYQLVRRLGGPQSRSGRGGEKIKIPSLPLPGIEPRFFVVATCTSSYWDKLYTNPSNSQLPHFNPQILQRVTRCVRMTQFFVVATYTSTYWHFTNAFCSQIFQSVTRCFYWQHDALFSTCRTVFLPGDVLHSLPFHVSKLCRSDDAACHTFQRVSGVIWVHDSDVACTIFITDISLERTPPW
jgi:hypothetical protein